MQFPNWFIYAFAVCLVMDQCCVEGKLNLFLNQREVRRLLGLSAELYYVREGVINEYALNFIVPVPAHISDLYFTWQSLAEAPLPYSLHVNVSNPALIPSPQLNVSLAGNVPTRQQTFRLALYCSGLASAEVDVVFTVNASLSLGETTSLMFRRRKICLKDENPPLNHAIQVEEPHSTATEPGDHTAQVFYIAIGCACALVAGLVFLTSFLYVRNKKRRHDRVRSSASADSQQTSAFLQRSGLETPDFPGPPASIKSHSSSCASFRRTPVYAVPIMQPPVQKMQHYSTSSSSHSHNKTHHHNVLLNQASSKASSRHELPVVPSYSINTLDSGSTTHSSNGPYKDLQEKVADLSIDRSRLKMRGAILEGTFGRLMYGVQIEPNGCEQDVYVKTVTDQASPMQISLMLNEGMAFYGLNHRNLLSVLGVSISDHQNAPLLVYPHQGYTNLKKFLLNCKFSPEAPTHSLTTQVIVDMSIQVILALQYLHRRKILHRDVATRNCMVDDHLRIKLCDTSLSRDLFPGDYHCLGDNENRPIKWMAVESISRKEFGPESDVWMFGVLLWELTTLAQQPYLEVDPFEMASYLKDGYRLAQPLNCPDELFAVMAYCWAMSPDDRPAITQLHAYLHDFHAHLNRFV